MTMTEQSSYFSAIAYVVCVTLHAFWGNCDDYHYRIERRFDGGLQVSADLTFTLPDDDAFGAADCCTCDVVITVNQDIPDLHEFICELCRGVEQVADYRVTNHPENPHAVVLQLCERLDNRHWHEEDFLLDVLEAIGKNMPQQVANLKLV